MTRKTSRSKLRKPRGKNASRPPPSKRASQKSLTPLPLPLALSGLGEGVVAAPLIATVLGGVPARDSGAASGVLLTATQVAHAGSVTVIGGLFVTVLGETHGGASEFASYARATSTGCAVVLVLALLTALAARRLGPEPRSAGGG